MLVVALCSVLCLGTLEDFILGKEEAVARLAASYKELQENRCATRVCNCSVSACGTEFEGFGCDTTSKRCSGDSCGGAVASMEHTVVRVAMRSDTTSRELVNDICATEAMLDTFRQNRVANDVDAWQYVAHKTGTLRMHPAIPQERSNRRCSDYDPRTRPWYAAAASGSKDVVLLIDRSGSMVTKHNYITGETRLEAVKRAVNAVLDTLTNTDFVSVVSFSDNAETLYGSSMLQADASNVARLKDAVGGLGTGGSTMMSPGFTEAFDLLRRGKGTEATTKCSKVILFLTDGFATDSAAAVLDAIKRGQDSLGAGDPVKIFTYSMGKDADGELPKRIACENNGVWTRIVDGGDPLVSMSSFYNYLAVGIHAGKARWTTPYEDAFGLGEMVTVTSGVYDTTGSVPLLIGVAGIDVKMSELIVYNGYEAAVSSLIQRSKVCPVLNTSECDLQILREAAGGACPSPAVPVSSCPKQADAECFTGFSFNNAMCQDLNTELVSTIPAEAAKGTRDVACCQCSSSGSSSDSNTVVIVVVVVIVTVVVVAMIVVYCCVCKKKPRSSPDQPFPEPSAPPKPGDL
eukprot:TRINITY_DN4877_c0_g4_i1.p1 TRINITY_DN4877_c0_g4~~TRINITY_DN4877_c0_g4_i1.p1  ORF type:complete len:575 (+),score=163.03 TRINITY_DN4877_c0_g4_i1:44-1768(+)